MEALFIIHPDLDLCMLSAWQWNICFFLSKLSIKLYEDLKLIYTYTIVVPSKILDAKTQWMFSL